MIIDGTNGLTFNNATTQASAGCVLQVVNASFTTAVSTSSSSMVTSGYSVSITPKFATSKIFMQFCGRVSTSGSGVGSGLAFYRGATNLTGTTGYAFRTVGADGQALQNPIWIDSPATTSATTYTLYFSAPLGGTIDLTPNGTSTYPSSIVLMEIAA
jgi:FtsP/CotA-like multicopper oxidase with cupredoxin domain